MQAVHCVALKSNHVYLFVDIYRTLLMFFIGNFKYVNCYIFFVPSHFLRWF